MLSYEIVKDLLDKYFEGATSLEEENILRGYFLRPDVDARLLSYAPMFRFFEQEKTVALSPETTERVLPKQELEVVHRTPKIAWRWAKTLRYAAAIAILVVGTGILFKTMWQPEPPTRVAQRKAKVIVFDENDDPQKALAEIEKALMKTSKKMKKGTDEALLGLEKVKKASDVLEK